MMVMRAIKLHADEIETDVALVRRLLAGQFPQWADLPVVPVASHGTDHDIYRLREAFHTLAQVLADSGPARSPRSAA